MTKLHLYNTLGRQKTVFKPIKKSAVTLYSCGPTVYNYAHLGNLRAYIFADILKRVLQYNNYKVKQVINITDVGHLTSDGDEGDDKLEKGAARENKSPRQIARFYEKAFKDDIKKLNVISPDYWTRATEHIDEQKLAIKKIIKNGYGYETATAVYFDVSKLKDYTALSGQKLADKKIAARGEVIVDPQKKSPADFVLWFKRVGKFKNHILYWSSPWGDGFPGWHIECSAMSVKYLGQNIDIHTGGIDHVAVHHTNERAQNIAAYGHDVVKRWMHNEFVVIGKNDKMAKSAGNFLTLQTVVDKGIDPLAYRYLCLKTHYRKPMSFDMSMVVAENKALERLRSYAYGQTTAQPSPLFKKKFLLAVNDDLNIPQALAVAWDVARSKLSTDVKRATLQLFDSALGLNLNQKPRVINRGKGPDEEVSSLNDKRQVARKNKDWVLADKLRQQIIAKGYAVEDTPTGSKLSELTKTAD